MATAQATAQAKAYPSQTPVARYSVSAPVGASTTASATLYSQTPRSAPP